MHRAKGALQPLQNPKPQLLPLEVMLYNRAPSNSRSSDKFQCNVSGHLSGHSIPWVKNMATKCPVPYVSPDTMYEIITMLTSLMPSKDFATSQIDCPSINIKFPQRLTSPQSIPFTATKYGTVSNTLPDRHTVPQATYDKYEVGLVTSKLILSI